jgi:hypothetical protein
VVVFAAFIGGTTAISVSIVGQFNCTDGNYECIERMVARVDRSFSSVSMGSLATPQRSGLSVRRNPMCINNPVDCGWSDAMGVRHIYDPEGLVLKVALAEDFGDKPIPALQIGTARNQADVIEAARRFDPHLEFDCYHTSERFYIGPRHSTHCLAMVATSLPLIGMDFDDDHMLKMVYIDNRKTID